MNIVRRCDNLANKDEIGDGLGAAHGLGSGEGVRCEAGSSVWLVDWQRVAAVITGVQSFIWVLSRMPKVSRRSTVRVVIRLGHRQ